MPNNCCIISRNSVVTDCYCLILESVAAQRRIHCSAVIYNQVIPFGEFISKQCVNIAITALAEQGIVGQAAVDGDGAGGQGGLGGFAGVLLADPADEGAIAHGGGRQGIAVGVLSYRNLSSGIHGEGRHKLTVGVVGDGVALGGIRRLPAPDGGAVVGGFIGDRGLGPKEDGGRSTAIQNKIRAGREGKIIGSVIVLDVYRIPGSIHGKRPSAIRSAAARISVQIITGGGSIVPQIGGRRLIPNAVQAVCSRAYCKHIIVRHIRQYVILELDSGRSKGSMASVGGAFIVCRAGKAGQNVHVCGVRIIRNDVVIGPGAGGFCYQLVALVAAALGAGEECVEGGVIAVDCEGRNRGDGLGGRGSVIKC